MPSPTLSVVVATRNRPDHAGPCVRSVLANPGNFDFVLVDQSDDARTRDSVLEYQADPRFRYVPTQTRGASNGRNVGISETKGDIIAFTDDDCRVSADWLQQVMGVFAAEPRAAIVFGRVAVPPDLQGKGFAAEFEPTDREYDGQFPRAGVLWGIGANMAVRRSVFDAIGCFDPLLGPGSAFNAGEECDLMIRSIASGYKVVNAHESFVWHLGVRAGSEASRLMRGYGVAMGATLTKHVRLRTPLASTLAAAWFAHFGGRALGNTMRLRKPSGMGLFVGLLRGAVSSLERPIDSQHGVYSQGPAR